jgi:hypothetical protein
MWSNYKSGTVMALLIGVGRNGGAGRKVTEATHAYGVQWDVTNSSPSVTRIGNLGLHATLPVQVQMRGCVLMDNGQVNYYLKPDDWTKKADGTAANLDGSDGQVMVRIPTFYWKFETDGNVRRVMISEFPISGYTQVPGMFVSAFEAALDRTNSKLASVVNTAAQFRGGNNNADWDEAVNTLLGRPATAISRTNFRTYARNRGLGWQMYFYLAHKVLWWLFVIEHGTRNSQAPVNGSLTAEGYRQGGLGDGVTTTNSTEWLNFNGYYPFIACGASNTLGNFTGEVSVEVTDFGGTGVNRTFTVPRYRGIENPFGHIWKNTDGINFKIQADDAGAESQVWTSDDPATWNDSNYVGYTNRGLLPRANGYMSEALFGDGGEFVPKLVAWGSTTYFCDYFYTSIPADGEALRALLLGGNAYNGSTAGFVFSLSHYSPSNTSASFGSRLCFFGA